MWGRTSILTILYVIFLALVGLAGITSDCVRAQEQGEESIKYDVVFKGVEDGELLSLLQAVSSTLELKSKPPPTISHLRTRARRDLPQLEKALRSKGYFSSKTDFELIENKPVQVVFSIGPGPRYRLKKISIRQMDVDSDQQVKQWPDPAQLGLKSGDPFEARAVVAARSKISAYLKRNGYPLAGVEDLEAIVDHADDTVSVTYMVKAGPKATFGNTVISGLQRVEEKYVRKKISWVEGQEYDSDRVSETRVALFQTGLFSRVDIRANETDPDGNLIVRMQLSERAHRTFKFGIGYETDTGAGAKMSWENRNMFGSGERLRFSALGNQVTRSFEGDLTFPEFLHPDQSFTLGLAFTDEDTDGFNSREVNASAIMERTFGEHVAVGLGVSYQHKELEEDDAVYGLVSVPLTFSLDTRNDILNPVSGYRVYLFGAPYMDILGRGNFIKSQVTYNHYLPLAKPDRLVYAMRASYGRIDGIVSDELPSDTLFYAGGGGSIRGFAYQKAGDLAGSDPTGGLSLVEFSNELRVKIIKSFGVAAFIDGGRAFSGETPTLEDDLFWGAGVGLRYYTPVGPLRLDVGVPLNPRQGIDAGYHIYISLGQAF